MSKINNTNYINIGDSQNESLIQKREERQIREEYKGKVENALKSSIISTSKLDSPYKNKKISDFIKETFNSDFEFDKKISDLSNYLEIKKKLLDSEFIDSSNSEEIENLEEILKFLEMRKISSLSNKNTFKGMKYLNSSERKILDNEKISISEQISELKNEDKKLEEKEEALLAKLAELHKKREYIKGNIKSKESGDEVLSNRISLLDEGLNGNKKEFIIPKREEQTSFGNDSKKDLEENIEEGEKQNDIEKGNQEGILNSKDSDIEQNLVENDKENLEEGEKQNDIEKGNQEGILNFKDSDIEQNLLENDNEESLGNESNGEVVEVNQDTIEQIKSGNGRYSSRETNKIDITQESENLSSDIYKYLSEADFIKSEVIEIKNLLTDKENEVENGFYKGLTVEEFQKDISYIEYKIENIMKKINSFKEDVTEKGFSKNENFSEILKFLEEINLEEDFDNFINKIFENKNESGKLEKGEDKLFEQLVDISQAFELFDKNNLTSVQIEEISKCKQVIKILESKDFLEEKYKYIISNLKDKISSFGLEESEENNSETEENKDTEKTELSEVEKQALTEIQGVDEFYNNEENSRKFGNRIFDFIGSILGKTPILFKYTYLFSVEKSFYYDIKELSKVNFSYKTIYEDEKLNKSESIKDILQKNLENFKKFFGIEEEMRKFSRNYEQNNLTESFEIIRNSEKEFEKLSNFNISILFEEELKKFEEKFNKILEEYNNAIENIKNSLEDLKDLENQEFIFNCENKINYIRKILDNKENNQNFTENKLEQETNISIGIIENNNLELNSEITTVSLSEHENTTFSENKETSEYIEKFPKNIILPKKEEKIILEGNEYLPGIKDGKGWKLISDQYIFSEFKDEKPNGLTVIYTETGIKKSEGIYENLKMKNGLQFDEKGKVIKKTVDGKTTKV